MDRRDLLKRVVAKIARSRPPKAWWDKMVKEVKHKNPDYSEDQVAKTVGNIWHNQISDYRVEKIKKHPQARSVEALSPKIDVEAALKELKEKTEEQIEVETAFKWAGRSCAAYQLVEQETTLSLKVARLQQAFDFRHESLEHASLSSDGGKLVHTVQSEIEKHRKKAQDHLDKLLEEK